MCITLRLFSSSFRSLIGDYGWFQVVFFGFFLLEKRVFQTDKLFHVLCWPVWIVEKQTSPKGSASNPTSSPIQLRITVGFTEQIPWHFDQWFEYSFEEWGNATWRRRKQGQKVQRSVKVVRLRVWRKYIL